jgi:hypothetical protein
MRIGPISLTILTLAAASAAPTLWAQTAGPGRASAPLAAVGEWRPDTVIAPDGTTVYCIVSASYAGKHELTIGTNAIGKVNLAIRLPGPRLTRGEETEVTIAVDQRLRRTVPSLALEADLLVIPTEGDQPLVEALERGYLLTIEGAPLRASFRLTGTTRALLRLKECTAKLTEAAVAFAREAEAAPPATVPEPAPSPSPPQAAQVSGQPPQPAPQSSPTAAAPPAEAPAETISPLLTAGFPPALALLLIDAGQAAATPITLPDHPPDSRLVDVAWQLGPMVGALYNRQLEPSLDLAAASQLYMDLARRRCGGQFGALMDPVETTGSNTHRLAHATCTVGDASAYTAFLFLRTKVPEFSAFGHEVLAQNRDLANQARAQLRQVILTLMERE